MAKIVFMGTPDFAVPSLKALIATHQVIGVVTQPDRPAGRGRQLQASPVKIMAEANGIPVYQPKSLRSKEAAEPLQAWAPELIVVAAFGQILRPHVLNLPPLGCVNVHASLLPRWRGAAPIHHAILAGDETTGISLMRLDEGLDTGPVYVQQAIPIRPDETTVTLHDRLAQLGAELLAGSLEALIDGRLVAKPQDNSQATYAPTLTKEAGLIDWSQSGQQIDRRIRAMTPWPSAFTHWHGQQLKILDADLLEEDGLPAGRPGQIIFYQGSAVVLAGAGAIQLNRVQLAGKQALAMADFLRGRPEFIGGLLPS